MNIENLTFSDRAALVASIARLHGRSEEENAEIGNAIQQIIGNDALKAGMDLEDVLAVVCITREFFKRTIIEATDQNPEVVESNPVVFYSFCIDQLLLRAIDVLQDASGVDAERFAWKKPETMQ